MKCFSIYKQKSPTMSKFEFPKLLVVTFFFSHFTSLCPMDDPIILGNSPSIVVLSK